MKSYATPLSLIFLLVSGFAIADQSYAEDGQDEWSFQIKPVLWNPSISLRFSDSDDGEDGNIEPDYCFFCFDKLTNCSYVLEYTLFLATCNMTPDS